MVDLNETLSDLEPLRARVHGRRCSRHLRETWFAGTLRDGSALAATGSARTFLEVGAAVRTGLLRDVDAPTGPADDAVMTVLDGVQDLDVHPDVAAALRLLADSGARVVALTNAALSQSEQLLERAGVADLVERRLSVDDAVG